VLTCLQFPCPFFPSTTPSTTPPPPPSLQDSFGNSSLFHKALKEAFESFCNKQVSGWRAGGRVGGWAGGRLVSDEDSKLVRLATCLHVARMYSASNLLPVNLPQPLPSTPCPLPCSFQVANASVAELMATFCDNLLKKVGSCGLVGGIS